MDLILHVFSGGIMRIWAFVAAIITVMPWLIFIIVPVALYITHRKYVNKQAAKCTERTRKCSEETYAGILAIHKSIQDSRK